jgi:DNA modification methylase/ParB-like chromosome segregation protein Spo0J
VELHEVCSIFPSMSDDEFANLKNDIAEHGLQEPIWTFDGKVIDGRHRLRACEELGIEVSRREWNGTEALLRSFVITQNLHRRHLTPSQRAAYVAEVLPTYEAEAKERHRAGSSTGGKSKGAGKKVGEKIPQPSRAPKATEQAGKSTNVNSRYVADSKAIKQADPQLHEKVKQGDVSIPAAKQEIRRRRKRAELEAKAKEAKAKAGAVEASGPLPWEIRQGDCLDVLSKIERGSVRLIFADPPYNIGIDYGQGTEADTLPGREYLDWCIAWAEAAERLLTPDGSMWVLINDEWADEIGCILRGFLHRRAWIKWYETFGVNNANNFNRCSRHLFYMVKDPRRLVFNPEAVNRQSARQTLYADKRANPEGKVWDDVWAIPRLAGTHKERLPDFPTQLPLELLTPIIGCASEPGDLILDPFSGSGTTGTAALRLGRRYIGIEANPKFAEMSRLRLTATVPISPEGE